MNFHNTTHTYTRPVPRSSVRNVLQFRLNLGELIDFLLLKKLGRVALLVLPVILLVQMLLTSSIREVNGRIISESGLLRQLSDRNVELLAIKAGLRSPAAVQKRAAEKLSLYTPGTDQIGWFDRRHGRFIYE